MEKRTMGAIGLLVLLLVGIVSIFAVSAQTQTNEDNKGMHFWGKDKHGVFGEGFRSHSGFFNHSTKLDKFKEQLNLSENVTKDDILEALKKKKETWKEQHTINLREKLDLPENASDEDVQKAFQEWREENKELLFSHRIWGFHQWKR